MSKKSIEKKRPLLEVVYDILKSDKQPKTFYELTDMIPKSGSTKEERAEYIARLYTNMNLDGRFLSIGDNFWGLRSWYPVEQREEEVAITLAPKRRKKKKKTADYDFDDYDDIEEDLDELDDDDYIDDDELDDDLEDDDDDYDDLDNDDDDEEIDDTDDDIDDLDDEDNEEEDDDEL